MCLKMKKVKQFIKECESRGFIYNIGGNPNSKLGYFFKIIRCYPKINRSIYFDTCNHSLKQGAKKALKFLKNYE